MGFDFLILGPLEVLEGDRRVDLGAPMQRALLAVLLLHRGEVVSTDRLIDELWGDHAPRSAVKIVHGYVSHLRRALGDGLLVTRGRGYTLDVERERFDVERFEHWAAEGRGALERGDPVRAAELLRGALGLWRGPPLADFAYEAFAQPESARLEEERLTVMEDRIDADLAAGGTSVVAELEALVREQPLRERLYGQLMLALYRDGRQADALEVYQRARAALTERLGLEPGPALRGIQALILEQAASLGARPAISSDAMPRSRITGLPQPATRTIGREREIAAGSRLLRSPDARLVTLTGAGGVGKTRLALAVARTIESRFSDGACWVELAGVARAEDIGSTVVRALAINPLQGESAGDSVRRYLAGRELLLVIDNFEHVLDGAVLVSELLVRCPRLKVLVTSREALDLSAEHRVEVPPLPVPARPENATVSEVESTHATALFVAAAQRRDSSFAVTAASAPVIARICASLDGLPLALELAAARVGLWSLEELADGIDRALDSVGTGPRDAPARHHTLRATIEWSYRLLDREQQQAFTRSAVFAGGASIDAARAVTRATAETLEALTAKSMLVSRHQPNRAARVVMLETIRYYGLQQLEQDGEHEAICRRHFEHYLDLVSHTVPGLHTENRRDSLAALDRELDNIRAALRWALGAAPLDALRLAGQLGEYWTARENFDQVRWLRAALKAAGQDAPPQDRARALLHQSRMFRLDDESGTFVEAAEAALALYTEAQDHAGIADTLCSLASLTGVFEGDLDGELRCYEEAYRHARISGDERLIGKALARVAVGREDPASVLKQAARILARTGSFQEIAISYAAAAWFALNEDRVAEAVEFLGPALAAARKTTSPWTLAAIWGGIGMARLFSGQLAQAREAFEEQLRLCERHALRDVTGEGLAGLGAIAARKGRYEAAARLRGASRSAGYPIKSDEWLDDRLERDYFAPTRAKSRLPAWSRAESEGQAMSEDQAIAYAISRSTSQDRPDPSAAAARRSALRLIE